jgi:ornithine cyclodeaminase
MKEGFIQYSNGNAVVPPVGELIFEDPQGDVHIKYGYIKKQDYYVIKIASGFYNNVQLGIPSGQGLMLLFKQQTGELEAILLDEGYLTNLRTVAAATLAAQYFAPREIKALGIIGTGTIAKLQIQEILKTDYCKSIWLWGRNREKAQELKSELGGKINIHIAESPSELAQNANVIITTTPAESPLLHADDIQVGTVIIAVGSDTELKQELDAAILGKASLVIADSIPQSKSRGEIYQAVKAGVISENDVVELGNALQDVNWRKGIGEQTIVVDLTGVAVQDIMIASAVFANHKAKTK